MLYRVRPGDEVAHAIRDIKSVDVKRRTITGSQEDELSKCITTCIQHLFVIPGHVFLSVSVVLKKKKKYPRHRNPNLIL